MTSMKIFPALHCTRLFADNRLVYKIITSTEMNDQSTILQNARPWWSPIKEIQALLTTQWWESIRKKQTKSLTLAFSSKMTFDGTNQPSIQHLRQPVNLISLERTSMTVLHQSRTSSTKHSCQTSPRLCNRLLGSVYQETYWWHWKNPDKAVLEPRVSPAFAITYFCNHCNIRFENTSKYVDTLTLFSKNLNQRSLTPRWPLTPCLLRSHVWLYPRITVSKSHDNTSMYVDQFRKLHTTYILRTEWVIT